MTPEAQDPWETATFEGARQAQNQEMSERPLIERLRWCCEVSELIRKRDIAEGKPSGAIFYRGLR